LVHHAICLFTSQLSLVPLESEDAQLITQYRGSRFLVLSTKS